MTSPPGIALRFDAKLTSGGSKKIMVCDGQREYFGKRVPTNGAAAEVPDTAVCKAVSRR
jgi:hypothetical protein